MEMKPKKWMSFREVCTNQFQKICPTRNPDYLKRDFLSDLLWQVIEKVADEPTLPFVRETFENAQDKLLCQIMTETGTLDLDMLSGMSEEISERIFQSIASDSFHLASELHLFAILLYPVSYPRIVHEFKHHLDNPVPQEPTKTKKILPSVMTKLKDTLFDSESLYAEENCLSNNCLKSIYPKGKGLVENDSELGMKHGADERRKMINLVLWKLIRKASYRSSTDYKRKDIMSVYERLSGVLWEELKDLDFIIFPEMDRKIGSDIFQLLSGNEDVVKDRLFHLMKMSHPIVDYKLVSCFKRTITHPRKVHLPKNYLRSTLKSNCKDVNSDMFCHKQVNPNLGSPTNCESKDKGEATDVVPCDLLLKDLESVNPETQNTTESPVSYNRRRGFEDSPKPQNMHITTVECENQTLIESVISGTVCGIYPDLDSSMSECRPIFIQVRPYKPVLEDPEQETPESQQNTKQDATNVNLGDPASEDIESVNSEGQDINENFMYVNEGDIVLVDLESLNSEGQYKYENLIYVNEGDLVLEDPNPLNV